MATPRKSIFVTGAASGIGRAVALHFAGKGWFAGLADVNRAGLAETAAMLPQGQYSIHELDVRDRKSWDKVLADFDAKAGGRLDVLFNNAGIGRGGPFDQVPHEDHDAMMDINIKGVVWGAEAGFPYLAKTPGSCLLNTASAAGIYGGAGMAVYAATKFAVRGLTEALDQEWEPHGIKVRSLMPAFIDTAILDGAGADTNQSTREVLKEAGVEISPVTVAAQAAWDAVHGDKVHVRVGKLAHRLWLLARFAPGLIPRQFRKMNLNRGG